MNDTDADVKRLAKLSRMIPGNINIIPFHRIDFKLNYPLDRYNKPENDNEIRVKLMEFIKKLKSHKIVVNLRTSSGEDINAACGQLAIKEM